MKRWTATNPTWELLSDNQKAAVMSIMEVGIGNLTDAEHAAGAMVNRADKDGAKLGEHVSRSIYQPTMERNQESRLNKIIASPDFAAMTEWVNKRTSGEIQDNVNGATHFLAHPSVMLELEEQNPQKYKNWGPRGANWTGYDEKTGKYSNQVFSDKSHAFLTPDGASGSGSAYASNARGISSQTSQQASRQPQQDTMARAMNVASAQQANGGGLLDRILNYGKNSGYSSPAQSSVSSQQRRQETEGALSRLLASIGSGSDIPRTAGSTASNVYGVANLNSKALFDAMSSARQDLENISEVQKPMAGQAIAASTSSGSPVDLSQLAKLLQARKIV